MFAPISSGAAIYPGNGFSIDDGTPGGVHFASAYYASSSALRRVTSDTNSLLATGATSNIVVGRVTSFNDDGFTVTFTTTGGSNDNFFWVARS